jgi:hypothetical protein
MPEAPTARSKRAIAAIAVVVVMVVLGVTLSARSLLDGDGKADVPIATTTMYPAPAIPDTPGSEFLGPAESVSFAQSNERLPHGFTPYPITYPTSEGGTYDPKLVKIDPQQGILAIQGTVDPTRVNEAAKRKDGSPNALPEFFTGTMSQDDPFLYGERTIVARFPALRDAQGNIVARHKPVLLLWPTDEAGNNWYHNVEIDFVEVFDTTRQRGEVNINFGKGEKRNISTEFLLGEEFHAYTVRWTPQGVHLFIDGVELKAMKAYREATAVVDEVDAMPNTPHRLVLQVDQAGIDESVLSRAPAAAQNVIEVKAIISRSYNGPV